MKTSRLGLLFPSRSRFWTSLISGAALWASPFARAGEGSIDTGNQTLNLSVLFSYPETDENLDGTGAPTWRAVFNDGSKRLWNATNGQLRIGKVTVYRRAFNKKESADVWILRGAGVAYANVGQLGTAGGHMTFHSDTHRSMNATYQGGFSIVHEAGHYVFGLRDQYLGASVPIAKKDTWVAADLSAYTSSSAFVFSVSANDAVASIMDGGGGSNNTRTEFDTAGNTVAGQADGTKWWMNKQWITNGKKSCWETMANFKWKGVTVFSNVPAGASPTDVPAGYSDIEWEVIPTLSRLALCIDRSGSMTIENRMDLAKGGARLLASLAQERHEFDLGTKHIVFEGDIIGIVDFDDITTTTFPMTEVDAAGVVKQNAKAAIDGLYARGSTAIGDGAQRSLDIITALGDRVTQEAIILLSDGQNNSGVSPASAAANASTRGAKIYTIALGSGADASALAGMAAATGGKFYQASSGLGLIDIYTRIYGELRGGGLMEALSNLAFEDSAESHTVAVDAFSEEVILGIASPDTGWTLRVKSPDGTTYTASNASDGVLFEDIGSEKHYRISHPKPGNWTVFVDSPPTSTGTTYQYTLLSNSLNPDVSITARTSKPTYVYPEPVLITCQVYAGAPVAGASVTADVSGPNGIVGEVTLFDDGLPIHGDETGGDAIYSNFYSALPASGTYSFTLRVENKKGFHAPEVQEQGTGDTKPVPIAQFVRETTANIAVSGAPTLDANWLRIDALQLTKNKATPTTGNLKLHCVLNSGKNLFSPAVDTLTLTVGGVSYALGPKLFLEKKPGVFSIVDKANGIQGSLKTEIGGSSRSELVLSLSKFPVTSFNFTTPTSVRLLFRALDEAVSIKNAVNSKGDGISYNARKDFLNTTMLYVDGLGGTVEHQQTGKDTFRLIATLDGPLTNFDPAVDPLVINVGGLVLTLPAGTLAFDAKGEKGKGTLAVGGGTTKVMLNLATGILTVSGSKMLLGPNIGKTTAVSVRLGTFDRSNLLILKEVAKSGKSKFTF